MSPRLRSPVPRSPALQLVMLVWKETRMRSWLGLNTTMSDALCLAISASLRFDTDDISTIHAKTRGGYWFGVGSERFYRLAVTSGNISAAQSWESWVKRPPFILGGRRLFVGSMVELGLAGVSGGRGVVTSFASDGTGITVCVYDVVWPNKDGSGSPEGKPKRRIKLTLSDVRAMEKARKEASKSKASK